MPNFQNSMIYKLCCNDPTITDCYVGSTVNFKCRKNDHKTCCNNENGKRYNFNVYKFIREHGGFENWSMILIENFPCDSKLELLKRERYWFETLGATLNKQVPSRGPNEAKKNYRDNNREKRNAKNREKFKCICGSIHSRINKSKHLKTKKHQAFISNS